MASSYKAPKQWALPSDATVTQFESWKNNLLFTLSLDSVNATFLKDDATWSKQSRNTPNRGFTNDPDTVEAAKRLTAAQKTNALQIMLGQIANYAPINRSIIVKNSTSLKDVWKAIRQHFGFQANGARVLDLADMCLKPGERPEELYQRLLSFMDDNLMKTDGGVKHLNADIAEDEEIIPSLENYIVVIWLQLLHKDLPKLVKQRYGTELRTNSLASIKNEISGALDPLLEEIQINQDSKALRSVISSRSRGNYNRTPHSSRSNYSSNPDRKFTRTSYKECPLCKQAGRPTTDHYLTECRHLPEKDKRFINNLKARYGTVESGDEEGEEEGELQNNSSGANAVSVDTSTDTPTARRVPVIPSPFINCYYKHHVVRVTIDSGATGNFIRLDIAKKIQANIRKNTQRSHQADGNSCLDIVGETTLRLNFKGHDLLLQALVATKLDEEILGGTPFMDHNDVWVRPNRKIFAIGECTYEYQLDDNNPVSKNNRVQVETIRSPSSVTVWPGDYIELQVPDKFSGKEVGLEPRTDSPLNSKCAASKVWPTPQMITCSSNSIRIQNNTTEPKLIRKDEHFCQIHKVTTEVKQPDTVIHKNENIVTVKDDHFAYKNVCIDPDKITPVEYKQKLESICESYGHVFNPKFTGYNGRDGAVKAVVNMGPVMPPQRKGRLPLYNRDKLDLLQNKFDELEALGVFARPENVGVNVEYLNPSFLVSKPRGGHRLVTDFGEVAHYAKPQPSLMPDMETTLRTIAQWNFIICTDLCKAYFQIPLDPASMKFCGVVTPFKGTRVYLTASMGMPGSETALEEINCRVFGPLIQEGGAAKIADNLFCGGITLDELCYNWEQLLKAASKNNLRLSAGQTIINPKSTNILGWLWCQGTLSANPHSVCTLQTCKLPETVTKLRSFIGAYKVLSRVIPGCANVIAPLDSMTAGRASSEKLNWSEQNTNNFNKAQQYLSNTSSITLPQKTDKLWIVLDATTKSPAIASTLYIERSPSDFKIAGFFSAKLKSNQIDWLPCEREALSIGSAVKYFQPFIVQSEHKTTILTDSKPCVQAFAKMQKGEFSASPRVSTFLSICHRFQISIRHIAGAQNMLSDHQSRNPASCEDSSCQVCRFILETEQSVLRSVTVQDVISGKCKVPFLSRTAWQATQLECPDLRRTHAHLKQGTRPSKKQTNIRDVKRYLNTVTIAKDGLIVVRNDEPSSTVRERIVVPRAVMDGLVSSLHLKLDHPTYHQLKLITRRYFFALDMDSAVERVSTTCHTCASLANLKHSKEMQSTSDPPDGVCTQFAADVIRREKQFIFVLRDVVTSYTWSLIIENEQGKCLRDALMKLCIPIKPIDGPRSVIRVDPAPGFVTLKENPELQQHGIILDIGRVKNTNKNPVAERAIEEIEIELLKQEPRGGPVTELTLAIATARLNTRIRSRGLSSREMLFQRDQFSNAQIPVNDLNLINEQYELKLKNHAYSEKSKAPLSDFRPATVVTVGNLVYLHNDNSKVKSRDRYIVTSTDNEWIYVRKFIGNQLRNVSYKVKRTECFKVPHAIKGCDPQLLCQISEDGDDWYVVDIPTPFNIKPTPPVTESSQPLTNSDSISAENEIEQSNNTVSDPLTLPEVFVPQSPIDVIPKSEQEKQSSPIEEVTEAYESHCQRPRRNCPPPEKLSIKWDNSQTYS